VNHWLSRGNRLRGLALLAAAAALAAYLPALGLPPRYQDFTAGLAWGMGVALLLAGALHWWRPQWLPDEDDRRQQQLAHRYLRDAAPGLLIYLALLCAAPWLAAHHPPGWLLLALCLLPLPALLVLLRATLRYLRDADELQRRIELEALAIAALVVSQACFAAWVLHRFGMIHLDTEPALAWVFAGVVLVRLLASVWLRRKYQ